MDDILVCQAGSSRSSARRLGRCRFALAVPVELGHLETDGYQYRNLGDKNRSSQEEHQADEGATEALIPAAEWDRSDVKRVPSAKNANALADRLRMGSAIVAGRVRHETGNWWL